MKMQTTKLVVFAVACAITAAAQDVHITPRVAKQKAPAALTATAKPTAGPILRPGMSEQDVLRIFGKPIGYYSSRTQTFFTPSEAHYVSRVSAMDPVYRRSTRKNSYEFRISYGVDQSRSRLNPTLRVQSVRIIVDKRMPAAEVLADLAEAAQICSAECQAVPESYTSSLTMTPKQSSEADTRAATFIGSYWGEEPVDSTYVFAVTFYPVGFGSSVNVAAMDLNAPVEFVEVGVHRTGVPINGGTEKITIGTVR